eukprot:9261200-Heterocapsa_arctica.AAC.1
MSMPESANFPPRDLSPLDYWCDLRGIDVGVMPLSSKISGNVCHNAFHVGTMFCSRWLRDVLHPGPKNGR